MKIDFINGFWVGWILGMIFISLLYWVFDPSTPKE